MNISEAQRKIAAILKDLERENDVVVRSVNLETINISKISDERPKLLQQVVIEVERLPGNNWSE